MSWVLSALVAVVCVFCISIIWPDVMPAIPDSGERGRRRREGIAAGGWFRWLEPLIRGLSVGTHAVAPDELLARAEDLMLRSGMVLGLNGDELLALSMISAGAGAIAGGGVCLWFDLGLAPGLVVGTVFGIVFPWFKLGDIAKRRLLIIARGLPGVLDLVALAMESGLDFTGAVRQVSTRLDPKNPIRFELEYLLQKLSLGWSRQAALEALQERVSILAVRQFVTAVIQAEKRGTPLVEVLATQAEVMRTKRSQHAEQAAARAAVFILGPLMLIFACVFAIILGPFIVRYLRGELI